MTKRIDKTKKIYGVDEFGDFRFATENLNGFRFYDQ
jgi:hypothetical protein